MNPALFSISASKRKVFQKCHFPDQVVADFQNLINGLCSDVHSGQTFADVARHRVFRHISRNRCALLDSRGSVRCLRSPGRALRKVDATGRPRLCAIRRFASAQKRVNRENVGLGHMCPNPTNRRRWTGPRVARQLRNGPDREGQFLPVNRCAFLYSSIEPVFSLLPRNTASLP